MLANNICKTAALLTRYCGRWALRLLLALLLGASLTPPVFANNAKEDQVKASYIYNFAKFVKWPAATITPDVMPFYICIEGVQPLSGNILLLQSRQLDGHKIEVRTFAEVTEPSQCNVLFIGNSEQDRLAKILSQVSSLPVLTISDLPDFTNNGGMIGMKVLDNRVRFDINLGVAQKAELELNSQLLKLALRVIL